MNLLAGTINRNIEKIVISQDNGKFVYDLFLTLLNWSQQKIKSSIYLSENCLVKGDPNFQYRILKALGFEITIVKELHSKSTVVHSSDMEACLAIVDTEIDGVSEKIVYKGFGDSIAIHAISDQIERTGIDQNNVVNSNIYAQIKPQLLPVEEVEYLKIMKGVHQYSPNTVTMEISIIDISKLYFLTKYVRGHKFRQISVLINLYKNSNIELFVPTKIVYSPGFQTYVGVPVVEKHNGEYYVIEGNTRFFTMARLGITSVKCLVVENVKDPLPSEGRYNINDILLTEGDHRGANRYKHFEYQYFRPIEKAVRNPHTSLL